MSEKYAIYTGDTVRTVSLWVRRDGKEYPIYANTRGKSEWYTHDTEEYENTTPTELSDEFVEWLAHLHRVRTGLVGAIEARETEPDADPEWYEVEILNAINQPGMTDEQAELLSWACEQVDE